MVRATFPLAMLLTLMAHAPLAAQVEQEDIRRRPAEVKTPPAKEDRGVITIYHLQHIEANAAQATLKQLYTGEDTTTKVATDERTNSLLIQANKAIQDEVAALLKALDQPNTTHLEIRTLRTHKSNDLLKQIGKMYNVEIARDEDSDTMIVRGGEKDVQRIQQIIEAIEAQRVASHATEGVYWVRIAWLRAKDLAATDAPPSLVKLETLPKIQQQLSKLGVEALAVGTQAVVRCELAGEPVKFSASGSGATKLGDAVLQVAGELIPQPKSVRAEINASLTIESEETEATRPSEVQVTAALVPGRTTVLAAGQLAGYDSVFVIELLPIE